MPNSHGMLQTIFPEALLSLLLLFIIFRPMVLMLSHQGGTLEVCVSVSELARMIEC